MSKSNLPLFVALTALLLGSCGDAAEPEATGPSQLDAFWSQDSPSGAREVLDIRSNAGVGDQIVVTGRIHHFGKGRAFILMTDSALKSCIDMNGPDCGCPTPWDYCCEDPAKLKTHIITVEFHDESGEPLHEGLKGFNGLDHLQTITVIGTVNKDDEGNVTVVATALHRDG